MDMVEPSSPKQSPRDGDVKSAFRKPSTDAASRKYRRPGGGSPNGDESRSPSPDSPHAYKRDRDSSRKRSDEYRRNGDDRDSYRNAENRRHGGDNGDRHKRSREMDSNYHSSRSNRESRDRSRHGFSKQRSGDDGRDGERYSRVQLDESNYRNQGREIETRDRHNERDGKKTSRSFVGDEKYDRSSAHQESRIRQQDLAFGERSDSSRAKDSHGNSRELDSEKEYKRKAEEKKYDRYKENSYRDLENSRKEEKNNGGKQDARKDKFTVSNSNVDNEFSGKRSKIERVSGFSEGPMPSKFSASAEEKQSLLAQDPKDSIAKSSQPTPSSASEVEAVHDLNAAKVAAMRAAELVNKNIAGCGILSTDQKKKLLWGNKSTTTVESGNRWDTSGFGDIERQEKLNKLMSLRLRCPIVGCERKCASGQAHQRQGLGEAKSIAVRVGEAIYCGTSQKGWSDGRIRPVASFATCLCPAQAPNLKHYFIFCFL